MRIMLFAIQVVAVLSLLAFYGWVAFLIGSPRVTEEYRAYYISRNTTDWRPVRYPATLAQGFDFSRAGYPDFVRLTEGISGHESWGRWTDARLNPVARVVFDRTFSGSTCVAVKARPASEQKGKKASIRLGDQEFQFLTFEDSPRWYQFNFYLARSANVLEIEASSPAPESVYFDSRKIGLGLYRLIVIPGACQLVGE